MADLTQAMGLNPSSTYAAFGDKRALFQHAVKSYMEMRAQYASTTQLSSSLRPVIRRPA